MSWRHLFADNMYLYANFDGTGISFLQNIPTDNFDWTLNSVKTISNLKIF